MAIYALSDLHLAYGIPQKTMEAFGKSWENYMARIEESWNSVVAPEDLVLVPGDICWATKLNEAVADFEHLNNLNGRKIISRGNHDYWWSTMNKIRAFLIENEFSTIDFIRNDDVYLEQGAVIAGTRGWNFPGVNEFVESDRKIYERELIRLNICIDSIKKADPEHKLKWIVTLHYPPLTKQHHSSGFTEILKEAGVDTCIYGHLHGLGHRSVFEGRLDNNPVTEYICAASDYVRFEPVKIL